MKYDKILVKYHNFQWNTIISSDIRWIVVKYDTFEWNTINCREIRYIRVKYHKLSWNTINSIVNYENLPRCFSHILWPAMTSMAMAMAPRQSWCDSTLNVLSQEGRHLEGAGLGAPGNRLMISSEILVEYRVDCSGF